MTPTKRERRRLAAYRLDAGTRRLIAGLASLRGTTATAVVCDAVRSMADAHGVTTADPPASR